MTPAPLDAGGRRAVVGVVGKPHGVHGDVHVRPDPDVDEAFPQGRVLRADDPSGRRAGSDLVVADARLHSGRRLVRFEGVDDRTAAEGLRGLVLTVSAADVELPADSYWSDDLLGREVVTADGGLVGVVEGVVDGPAHDYLVLARPDGGETLIPAVDALVDVGDERIVVHAIPGLLDEPAG